MAERKPNIKSLVRREDIDGLLEAASYQDLTQNSAEAVIDLGIPVRTDAIVALGTIAPERGHKAIAAGIHDPADRVRCAAVRVLHALREGSVLADALRWLPPDQGHSRKLAMQAIIDLRNSVSPSAVAAALVHHEDDDLLGEQDAQLIEALLEKEGPDATDAVLQLLVRALGDNRGIVVDRAAEVLVRLAPQSIETLVRELRMGSNAADAAYVLGRIGDPETLDALVKALRHRDSRVRAESAAAMGELRDPAAVTPLLRATQDPEHTVRRQASMALDRMGTAAVIEGVAELLRPVVREAVRSAVPPSRRTNGGPPEAVDPTPIRQQMTQ